MKQLETKLMVETSNIPTQYEFKKSAIQRGLISTRNELQWFGRTEAGVIGEQNFTDKMIEFGKPHWHYLCNIWLNDSSDFECDNLSITNHCIYCFEVKKYLGLFEYQNGQAYLRGTTLDYNPINQARSMTVQMKNIMQKFPYDIPVKGVMVFIDENNKVVIKDEIDYIDILSLTDIYQYIQEMIAEERNSPRITNVRQIVDHIEKYEIKRPHLPRPYNREEMKQAKPGVFCEMCAKPVQLTEKKTIQCSCSFRESREKMIIRTACEYGVLTYGRDFTIGEIQRFLGNQISTNNLKIHLDNHFDQVVDSKVHSYRNPGRLLSHLPDTFQGKMK